MANLLLRQGSNSKLPLKAKIVRIYEEFFKGIEPSGGNQNFWDELFLLKADVQYIETSLGQLNADELLSLKENINSLFHHCTLALKDDSMIKIVNALQTLCALVRSVYRRSLVDHSFDVINILIGFDTAEAEMQILTDNVNTILVGEYTVSLKNLSLKLLLILSTITDNISQNTILEYIMMNSVFESLVQILSNPLSRQNHGYDTVMLLAILVNYRKYESANPYILKLSILDDELALNGLGYVIGSALNDFDRQFKAKEEETTGGVGLFATITNMVGSMFEGETACPDIKLRTNDSILLALYEAVHLNRNFLTVLTQNHTASDLPQLTSPTAKPAASGVVPSDQSLDVVNQPTNILVTFLRYCSIILPGIKDELKLNNSKLCLIVLTCIVEDQYANSFLHDANMTFRVNLYRAPMRHRKQLLDQSSPGRPLACSLLDLMVEFIMSHMMKNLSLELYIKCLGIVHRVICYQKKCRVRLHYNWTELWSALVSLIKFILSNESELNMKFDIFQLALQAVNLFNMFITYGDTFLPSPNSYDELYYEIIRMHQVFDNLHSLALRHSTNGGQWKNAATKLTNTLVNIRAIINHFTPKIDSWSATNQHDALTTKQVLEIVRSNYGTLTLKLQDNLDQFDRYAEKPKETAFFTHLVRSIVLDCRQHICLTNLEQQSLLQELRGSLIQ